MKVVVIARLRLHLKATGKPAAGEVALAPVAQMVRNHVLFRVPAQQVARALSQQPQETVQMHLVQYLKATGKSVAGGAVQDPVVPAERNHALLHVPAQQVARVLSQQPQEAVQTHRAQYLKAAGKLAVGEVALALVVPAERNIGR